MILPPTWSNVRGSLRHVLFPACSVAIRQLMGPRTFSKHYCVCIREDGTPREISRLGSVVTYKAIDYRSGRPVALQVIPLTSIEDSVRERFHEQVQSAQKLDHINVAKVFAVGVEHEHIVFVTEYLQGETADAWVVAHGPMTPDAVVRVGLQVASALGAAIFHGLAHRSIQPSNVMIVSGTTPEGDWPFVKLLNFGLAGLRLYSEGNEPRELVPSMAPAFASPEQLQGGRVDFRSEIFSLGATMCFLLTGAVPLAGVPAGNGVAERILPSPRQIPRPLRTLLKQMLRHDPEERPQDPVAFSEELRRCLEKISRRPRIESRSLPTLVPDIEALPESRPRRALSIGLAFAAVLGALALVSAVLMPERWQSLSTQKRDISNLGIPIGVPDTTPNTSPPSSAAPTTTLEQNQAGLAANANSSQARPDEKAAQPAITAVGPANDSAAVTASPMLGNRTDNAGRGNPVVVNPAGNSGPVQRSLLPPPAEVVPAKSGSPSSGSELAPQLAANKSAAEPSPPAEGPSVSPEDTSTREQPAAAQNQPDANASTAETNRQVRTPQDVWNNLRSNAEGGIANASPPPIKSAAESKPAASRKKGKAGRDRQVTENRRRSLPQMRVGSMRAEFVGTTQDGSWILQLPNGKTVVTPPVPNVDDVPVEHRRMRRAATPPRAEVPFDQRPPVLVLPPDT